MKKKLLFRTIFWVVALFSYSPSVFGNGDPVMWYSSLIGSSNPVSREITDIQILREELYIRPGKYSQVVVRYLLYNSSDKDYTDIDYGFPVDYLGGGKEHENSAPISDETSESKYVFGWHDDYIRNIAFSLNGKALSWKPSEEAIYQEPPLPDRKNYQADEDGQFWYDLDVSDHWMRITYRRWFYTRFSVKKGETVTLEVRYALRNQSKGPVYDFNATCDNELVYDLSPASHWGDGTARELLVRIDASDIIQDRGMSITGLPESSLKQDGANYSCLMKDFAFRNAEPIRLCYDVFALGDALELLHHRIPADEYEITSEKELADYPASNLSDLNFSTAWVATIGDEYNKICIRFREPTRIAGFALVNGYHKSQSAYLNNNRVSEVDMTIDGESSGSIYFYETVARKTYYDNNDYEPLYFGNMIGHPDVYYYHRVFNREKVKKIELEITRIHPGAKYNDICLSEIIFFRDIWPDDLDKKSDADEP